MYGLIGKMIAAHGQRDALAAILLGGTGSMPGCPLIAGFSNRIETVLVGGFGLPGS